MRCNCENSRCPHGERACRNSAGKKKVMYVGAVCDDCYENMPPEYRSPDDKDLPIGDDLLESLTSFFTNTVELPDAPRGLALKSVWWEERGDWKYPWRIVKYVGGIAQGYPSGEPVKTRGSLYRGYEVVILDHEDKLKTVYEGKDRKMAEATFDEYVHRSKLRSGAHSGASVALFENGETVAEHAGHHRSRR